MPKCPVCKGNAGIDEKFYGVLVDCPDCGLFRISTAAMEILKQITLATEQHRNASETIHKMSLKNSDFMLTNIDFGPGKFVDSPRAE